MSPKRAVLLLSWAIAVVVLLTVAYLSASHRVYLEPLTEAPSEIANLAAHHPPRVAPLNGDREMLWKLSRYSDPGSVRTLELSEDAAQGSSQRVSAVVIVPADTASSEEVLRQDLGRNWRSREKSEDDGATDDLSQRQKESTEPVSAAVMSSDEVRNEKVLIQDSKPSYEENFSESSDALHSQVVNTGPPSKNTPSHTVKNDEVLIQNHELYSTTSDVLEQQQGQELKVVSVAMSSNEEEARNSVYESNHDESPGDEKLPGNEELPVLPLSMGNGMDQGAGHDSSKLVGESQALPARNFSIGSGFQFPHPQVFLPAHTILRADWVQDLKNYLLSIHPARSLTITVATKSFIPNLLNWLIAANLVVQPPMQNVLVLAFDMDVHILMAKRKIPNIHVPIRAVIKGNRRGVSTVWMTRLAVIRLLNYWGYDVLQLDNDAIPLKNPKFLYEPYSDYELTGARGKLPFNLGRGAWGFTLCMGAALLRGTEKMGEGFTPYWVHSHAQGLMYNLLYKMQLLCISHAYFFVRHFSNALAA